jgi:hypothetical protein
MESPRYIDQNKSQSQRSWEGSLEQESWKLCSQVAEPRWWTSRLPMLLVGAVEGEEQWLKLWVLVLLVVAHMMEETERWCWCWY